MLNRLLSQNRIFIALVLALVFVASGLLYLNTVKRQATRDIQRPQARVNAPKPPPPGETAESGHWHGDVWHAEPHESVEVAPKPVQPPKAAETVAVFEVTEAMKQRYRRFQEIAKTLPADATIDDVVEASGLVPSQEELRAMSGDELLSLREDALQKANEIFPELQRRRKRVINGANEPHAYNEPHGYIEVIEYEFQLRKTPADLAFAEHQRRVNTSFERLPPDQRFLTIISPKAAAELKKQLEEWYEKERQKKESN